jgi:hypothetical protein
LELGGEIEIYVCEKKISVVQPIQRIPTKVIIGFVDGKMTTKENRKWWQGKSPLVFRIRLGNGIILL